MIPSLKTSSNFYIVTIPGERLLYFSYETLIGFKIGERIVLRENLWGTNTGKHLNSISTDKSIRFDSLIFSNLYKKLWNPEFM